MSYLTAKRIIGRKLPKTAKHETLRSAALSDSLHSFLTTTLFEGVISHWKWHRSTKGQVSGIIPSLSRDTVDLGYCLSVIKAFEIISSLLPPLVAFISSASRCRGYSIRVSVSVTVVDMPRSSIGVLGMFPFTGGLPVGQLAVDEYGNPFVIMQDQNDKKRVTGLDAQKVALTLYQRVTYSFRRLTFSLHVASLRPSGLVLALRVSVILNKGDLIVIAGMDKIIVGPDGDVTVTNDGATILDKMQVENQVAKLMVELSKSQVN